MNAGKNKTDETLDINKLVDNLMEEGFIDEDKNKPKENKNEEEVFKWWKCPEDEDIQSPDQEEINFDAILVRKESEDKPKKKINLGEMMNNVPTHSNQHSNNSNCDMDAGVKMSIDNVYSTVKTNEK